MKYVRRAAHTRLLVTILCCGSSFPAVAQTTAPTGVTGEATPNGTEPTADIIVTAQKRSQRLQDVPISVIALGGDTLRAAGVKDVKDLQILTPGLNVNSSSNEVTTTIRIHGVGTVGENPGIESSVGVVIDGVYRPRNGVAFNDLGPIERIEVLRGPQGTLFGKNTSAGVVSVISQAPKFTFGGTAELTAGNYGAIGGSAMFTGPIISDKLAASLFVTRRSRDGFYQVRTGAGPRTETDDANQNYYSVRGQLLYRPTSTLDVRLIADYTRRREHCCSGVQTITGPTARYIDSLSPDSGVAQPADPFARISYTNRNTELQVDDKGISGEINWETPWLNGARLTSITAVRKWSGFTGTDLDFTSADILYRPVDLNGSIFKQFSQEVRFAGHTDWLDFLVGGFYADERLHNATPNIFGRDYETYLSLLLSGGADPLRLSKLTGLTPGAIFPEGSGQRDQFFQTSRSLALFTNNTIKVSSRLEATIGLRYTHETKSVLSLYNNLPGDAGCAAVLARGAAATNGTVCLPWTDPGFANYTTRQRRSESEWTGTAKIAYHLNRDIMAYASYAKGYKAGGFNLDRARLALGVPNPDTEIAPEFAKSWDVGLKTSWFNRTLSINLAAFDQRFTNFQLNVFTGVSNIVVSVPEVKSTGVDLDFLWRTPLRGFSLQGGATYADTHYGQFVPTAGVPALLPNNQLSFAPRWSGSIAADYQRPIGETLKGSINFNVKYSSSYNTGSDLAPQKLQTAFALVDGRVSLGAADDRWALEIWAKNLTDVKYRQVVIGGTLQSGTFDAFLGAPRTVGATLTTRF